MELLPKEQLIFNDIVNKVTNVYSQNGFLPMDTPIIEKASVLLAKSAGETEKQVYSFKKGDKDLALRFDLTVPLAKCLKTAMSLFFLSTVLFSGFMLCKF